MIDDNTMHTTLPLSSLQRPLGHLAPQTRPTVAASAVEYISASQFTRYPVSGDGNCLFRALSMGNMGQQQSEAGNDAVLALRLSAADYVNHHRELLIQHPSLGGAQGVADLFELLSTPGQWNHDVGDLVAPIMASLLGREVRIVLPSAQGVGYELNNNRIFRPDTMVFPQNPAPQNHPPIVQPPIYLLHINGTHYDYLAPRYPQAEVNVETPQPLTDDFPPFTADDIRVLADLLASDSPSPVQGSSAGVQTDSESSHRAASVISGFSSVWEEDDYSNIDIENGTVSLVGGLSSALGDQAPGHIDKDPAPIEDSAADHNSGSRKRGLSPERVGEAPSKKNRYMLNHQQRDEMAQLWLQHPHWGTVKLTRAFQELHPNLKGRFTDMVAKRLKESHPELKGKVLGVAVERRVLTPEQENQIAQLWLANRDWGSTKMIQQIQRLYPSFKGVFLQALVKNLRESHPALQGMTLGGKRMMKPLTAEQEDALATLWLKNMKWSYKKIAKEYGQQIGVNISDRAARRLKAEHPRLKGQPLGSLSTATNLADKLRHRQKQFALQAQMQEAESRERGPLSVVVPANALGVAGGESDPAHHAPATSRKKRSPGLTPEQKDQIAQLWLEHRHWGSRNIMNEFHRRHPESKDNCTEGLVKLLKKSHPALQGVALGGVRSPKALTPVQEDDMAQLWLEHRDWSAAKIVKAFQERHPELEGRFTSMVAARLKKTHPALKGLALGSRSCH